MSLEVKKGFFTDRSEVMDDIKKTGFWPTTFVSEPYPGVSVHWHDVDINGYVISGSTWVRDGKTGEKLTIQAGDKLIIPRGALHAEGGSHRHRPPISSPPLGRVNCSTCSK